ncbi:hypothetical protein GF327_09070, partial [Candidatus Woesearchaeota archaeon]|nr:hypothetical protein [Candidatus Woesearchaeota archaeon]
MIKLSEFRVIEDAFFNTDLEYYKPSVLSFLEENFSENQEFSETGIAKLNKLAIQTNEKAHDLILRHDLESIKEQLDKTPKEFDQEIWRDYLPEIREKIKNLLGIDFKPRSIFFEKAFPPGLFIFEKKGASSVTIFEGQPNAGIYFLNKRISSFFTPILLIHEQIHSCLSQNKSKDQIYIEWFEEGLCQWYSMMIYYELTNNKKVIDLYKERNYIYSKTKPEYNFTRRYFEYMKIFEHLFLHGGPKLIGKILVKYLSNERDKVNTYLNFADLKIKYQPSSEIEDMLLKFTAVIEPEKITPLEYLILKSIKKPKTIKTLSVMIDAPEEVIKKGILRLKLKGMIVIKEKFVEINWRKQDLLENGLIKAVYP